MTTIEELASRQLAAYNASALDAFVACYHEDVLVLAGDEESLRGRSDFRERYRSLFEGAWDFGAAVPQRLSAGAHCVDYETWWRIDPDTGERSEGVVLVRYSERDDLIGVVQFLS
jgi:hypothetical protein